MEKYHMTKQDRQINDENEINEILKQGKYAVISMCRDNEPYIVTLNYGYDDSRKVIYFHAAPKGLKLEFIKQNPNICATIIDDLGYVKNKCTHAFRSLVLFGTITFVESLEEKIHGMEVLLNHLEENPDAIRERSLKNEGAYNGVTILRFDITHISGKKGS